MIVDRQIICSLYLSTRVGRLSLQLYLTYLYCHYYPFLAANSPSFLRLSRISYNSAIEFGFNLLCTVFHYRFLPTGLLETTRYVARPSPALQTVHRLEWWDPFYVCVLGDEDYCFAVLDVKERGW
jgi:hypothetical protein